MPRGAENQAQGFAARARAYVTRHRACKATTNQPEDQKLDASGVTTAPRVNSSISCFLNQALPKQSPGQCFWLAEPRSGALNRTARKAGRASTGIPGGGGGSPQTREEGSHSGRQPTNMPTNQYTRLVKCQSISFRRQLQRGVPDSWYVPSLFLWKVQRIPDRIQ